MAKVTFCGYEYECSKAVKGSDFVRLLDSDGCVIASFEGVVDFSKFTLSGCSWSSTDVFKTATYTTTYTGTVKSVAIDGVTANDLLLVTDASDFRWIQENIAITLSENTVTFSSATVPNSAITIYFQIMQSGSAMAV